ncbi:hypothetical protein E2C01_022032 [Portunus trituberculatus]|uniref:Uncharacterized protein n=1 Tax=Portunus trituberculatus TaxID=210409 RepID=A0A5B7E459_PORTR|nr:hypothetical protein [Portunus trituberculatus]
MVEQQETRQPSPTRLQKNRRSGTTHPGGSRSLRQYPSSGSGTGVAMGYTPSWKNRTKRLYLWNCMGPIQF